MRTLEEVIEALDACFELAHIESYIQKSWINPIERDKTSYFDDIDIARIRLIYQVQNDFEINDDGIDLILLLLDQLYSARAQAKVLATAIEAQPETVRDMILSEVQQITKESSR